MKFIDEAKIHVKAGDGGDGCVSFRREKYVPRGGPDGGNGGKGGDVILYADEGIETLMDYHYRRHLKAKKGEHGRGKDMHGASGLDLKVPVPAGTVIREGETLIADLDHVGAQCIVARGGRGGFGNAHYKSSTRQAPRERTFGEAGEEKEIFLELKLLADVGLVGLPNAGKSSLLRAVSAAHPTVADYPFTTKNPVLGVVFLSGQRSFTIADLPGLIGGAHEGAGMGIQFLRHIERTRLLLHLVDLSTVEPEDLLQSFRAIEVELQEYDPKLLDRPRIIVLTKIDLPVVGERSYAAGEKFRGLGFEVFMTSALKHEGLKGLLEKVWQTLQQTSHNGMEAGEQKD